MTLFASPGLSQESSGPDYSDRLPSIPPRSAEEAKSLFETIPGYEMQLVAAEPMVVDPIAMAFDESGRMYVVEMRGYSEDGGLNLGRIRLLEDTDQDGAADRSTVFAEGLSWPTAVACWDGGVFAVVPPDLLYLKDTGGDGRADVRRVIWTGFSRD
ncbi:MAG: DUF7133 domain-containing protein, partial [Planctomycetota bacterium]